VSKKFIFLAKKILFPGLDIGIRKRMKFSKYLKKGEILTLDVGCGNGAFSFAAYKRGNSVIGIDFDEQKLERTEKFRDYLGLNPQRCSFKTLNVYKAKVLQKKFDQIICFETLEHLKNDEKVIEIFSQILKENGILHLCVPYLKRNPYYGEIISEIEDGNHVRLGYTFEELEQMLEKSGFKIIKRDTAVGFFAQKLINFNNWLDLNLLEKYSNRIKDLAHFLSFIFLYPSTFLDKFIPSKQLNIYINAEK